MAKNEVPAPLDGVAKQIRRDLLAMMARSKSSHLGACLSIVEALVVLYFRVMEIDPRDPNREDRDRFILSKAHASAALYATLANRGFFSRDRLEQYFIDNGTLPGHLDRSAAPGVESSGGSLGHGLSLGIGMALAQRYRNQAGRVFVLLGDGECNEGSVWEAAMLAPQQGLTNLVALIDYNKLQSFGRTDEILNQANMAQRWEAFGWDTAELNGHDLHALEHALRTTGTKPKLLVLHTVKGKGVSFMEDKLAWHYKSPSPEELEQALKELA